MFTPRKYIYEFLLYLNRERKRNIENEKKIYTELSMHENQRCLMMTKKSNFQRKKKLKRISFNSADQKSFFRSTTAMAIPSSACFVSTLRL